jgi:hypothetical protein
MDEKVKDIYCEATEIFGNVYMGLELKPEKQ